MFKVFPRKKEEKTNLIKLLLLIIYVKEILINISFYLSIALFICIIMEKKDIDEKEWENLKKKLFVYYVIIQANDEDDYQI